MKLLTIILVSILLGISSSCLQNNNVDNDDCNPNAICYTQAPPTLFVKLRLSPNLNGTPVKVRVYVGDVDDGILYDSFETFNAEETYLLPVNEDYSAEAEYTDGEITIIAVDGDRLNRRSFQNCGNTCYDWDHSITLDLELDE